MYSYGRQALIGQLFCMFRLWAIAKYAGSFVDCMEIIFRAEAIRVCSPPPAEEVAVVEAFKKAIMDIDREVLCRLARKSKQGRAPKQSRYRAAMLEYLVLFNAPLSATVTHYCWDSVRGRPCCKSKADMLDKMSAASDRVFLQRRPETPTQKEWTRVRLACCWVCLGLTRSRLLARGVRAAIQVMRTGSSGVRELPPVAAHAVGAGENDIVQINASRLDSTMDFLEDESTGPQLCCIALGSQPTGNHLYHLLGGLGKPVLAQDMLGVRESRVAKMAEELLELLQCWSQPEHENKWLMLSCWAGDWQRNESMLRMARRQTFAQYGGL